jgi:hypothetical protein
MKRRSALLVTEVNFLPVKSRAGQGTVFHDDNVWLDLPQLINHGIIQIR